MPPAIPQLLADLVRRPSVNPMGRDDLPPDLTLEHRVTDYLEAQLKTLGVSVRRQPVAPGRDNLVAEYRPPAPPPFTVLWECHQDTVPVDGMTVDPFGAVIEGGKLYGRGACDVKAGAAAMLTAFARLVRTQPAGAAAVTLAFTVDEEHTFLGVQHLMRSGVRADCAVVAEPTGLNVVQAHKGVVRWQIETSGRACHSSRPEQGVNAVYRMARLLLGVEEYTDRLRAGRSDPALGPPTLSVGSVRGGASPNTVPDFCRIEIDRRLIPGEAAADAPAELDAFLRGLPGVDFPFVTTAPAFACPPLSPENAGPLAARLGRAIDAVVGRHEVHAVPYGTDASTIAEAGVPAVVFGPGDIAQAHTKDEWVELAQVEAATDILFRFACGG
jgi:acetylornithine deacetylase/succinyl-diaminopimelate desuccinylase family protein